MTIYQQFYSSSDVYAFIENRKTGAQVQIDTLSSIGWNEQLSSGPIYGLGLQLGSFRNHGNLFVSGVIEVPFTDEKYFQYILEECFKSDKIDTKTALDQFKNGNFQTAKFASFRLKEQEKRPSELTGIHLYPNGFNTRVILNNGNPFRDDTNKTFLIEDCKIVSRQFGVSVTQGGSALTLSHSFIAKNVKS